MDIIKWLSNKPACLRLEMDNEYGDCVKIKMINESFNISLARVLSKLEIEKSDYCLTNILDELFETIMDACLYNLYYGGRI